MSNIGAFLPQGQTTAISVGATASTPVQVAVGGAPNMNAYLLQATGACFVAMTAAAANAVVPVPGTPANGIPLQANVPLLVEGPPNAWFSTIASTGTPTVYVTPGDGATH